MFHITAFVPQWPAYIPSNIDSGLEKVVQALSRLYVLLFPRPPPQSHLIHMLYLGDVVLRYRTGVRCNVSQDARILFVITVDGKEKERTETLIKVSDSSWKLHPYISVSVHYALPTSVLIHISSIADQTMALLLD